MNDTGSWFHHNQEPEPPPMLMLMPDPRTALTVEEVQELWSFVHGDIMIGGIREHLRRAFGLCPRHSWGYAVVEIELWLYGPAPRGGHIPFDVGILYDDLLDYAASVLASAHHSSRHGLHALLTPRAGCRICDNLRVESTEAIGVGYAGSNSDELTTEASTLEFTTDWCRRTQEHWNNRVCPACDTRTSADTRPDPVLFCRRHLAAAGPVDDTVPLAVADRLHEVRGRLQRMVESMTEHGRQATDADDAAVIETLGWFAGWQLPIALTADN